MSTGNSVADGFDDIMKRIQKEDESGCEEEKVLAKCDICWDEFEQKDIHVMNIPGAFRSTIMCNECFKFLGEYERTDAEG